MRKIFAFLMVTADGYHETDAGRAVLAQRR